MTQQAEARRDEAQQALRDAEGAALKDAATASALKHMQAQVADAIASSKSAQLDDDAHNASLELLVAEQRHEIDVSKVGFCLRGSCVSMTPLVSAAVFADEGAARRRTSQKPEEILGGDSTTERGACTVPT